MAGQRSEGRRQIAGLPRAGRNARLQCHVNSTKRIEEDEMAVHVTARAATQSLR